MKKLVIGLCSFLIAASCGRSKKQEAFQQDTVSFSKTDTTAMRMSLNGILYKDVNKMISNYFGEPANQGPKSSFWFSKAYIDSLDVLLSAENADGIRVYFARTDDGQNTIVIVSTKDDGPDIAYPKTEDHNDYFKHSATFLHSAIARDSVENGHDGGGAQLYGRPQCPVLGCNTYSDHYVKCVDANNWVRGYRDNNISTHSEWFSKDLISYFRADLDAAISAGQKADGVRIYYALRATDNMNVFIWVTTKLNDNKSHEDYYECYANAFTAKLKQALTGPQDNGELCPTHCQGATLPQP